MLARVAPEKIATHNPADFHLMSVLQECKMKIKCICKQCGKEFYQYACYVKRGQGKFCSISCGVTYRNLTNNPANGVNSDISPFSLTSCTNGRS